MSSLTYLCFSMLLIHSTTASDTEQINDIQLLVSNGDGFRPDVHNYLVMLKISLHDSPERYLCSGSIIDKEWIITAAHCFPDNTKEIKIMQKFRSRNRVIGFARESVKHPNSHKHLNFENDLALVRTLKPIKFKAYTQPIALSRLSAFGQQGTIAGYGGSEFGFGIPLEGTVVVTQCESPEGSCMLCSQSLAYVNDGDSGGALTTDDGLVGVVAASVTWSTGRRESIYVDISLHFNWIQEVTGKKLIHEHDTDTSCDCSCGC